jgi:hypothetical protein
MGDNPNWKKIDDQLDGDIENFKVILDELFAEIGSSKR